MPNDRRHTLLRLHAVRMPIFRIRPRKHQAACARASTASLRIDAHTPREVVLPLFQAVMRGKYHFAGRQRTL